MTKQSRYLDRISALVLALAVSSPAVVHAQELPYGDVSAGSADDGDVDEGDSNVVTAGGHKSKPRVKITPYIEASQVVSAELTPGNDVLTYSAVAAGVEAAIAGRNNQGSVSLRYERRFGYGKKVSDNDTLSGVGRFSTGIIGRALTFEMGAMAARTSVENNGAVVTGNEYGDSITQVWSAYAGPSVQTRVGNVAVEGHYRFGYTKVGTPKSVTVAAGQAPVDLFDNSKVHSAQLHAGTKPGEGLPIGIGLGAGWNRQDVSNLDQRIEDKNVRLDAALPLGNDLSLVGGVGYEKVQVSSRDAVRDPITNQPVVGPNGRMVTDPASPRVMAMDTSGLIWDAGVMYRPSKRTAMEAHVGRRYGSTSYYGSFAYAPSAQMQINVSVYDTINSLGGQVNNALASLPTEFSAVRNPLNGDLGGCVAGQANGAQGQSNCFGGALAGLRSAVFRDRGVMASLGVTERALQYGIAAGFDRRKFIAAPGTVLASANGTVDQNVWVAAYLNGRIDRNSSFGTNVWANWYQSGDASAGNVNAYGATASYYRSITRGLSATAAVGINGVNRETLDDALSAQAMAGVRYSF